jgi:hypothetical protein
VSGIEAVRLKCPFSTVPLAIYIQYPPLKMAHFTRFACPLTLMLPIAVCAADRDGLIEAKQQVELRSPVEAVVETVQVPRGGDTVKKGKPFTTPESDPQRAAPERAKSRANSKPPKRASI